MLRARNYSWAIFVFVVILASIWYLVFGRKAFRGQLRRRDEACLQTGNDPLTYNATHGSVKLPSEHIRSQDEAA